MRKLLVATPLMAIAVAACGGGGGASNDAATKNVNNPASLKGQTIEYWASNQAPTIQDDQKILKQEAAKFTQETGVKVKVKVIGWPDLFNNITTATTSGQGPDVLNIGNTWSASLQATGAFMKFDDKTLNAIGGKDKFVASSFSATGAPGQTPTSVPLYGLSYALFYNKKMFKQAGISSPPKTWSEFVADAKKLTIPGKQWGVTIEGASITENSHWGFILGKQKGVDLFTKDNKPQFSTPQEVQAVKAYVDLIGADKVAAPNNATYGNGTEAPDDFAKGKAAMLLWQNNAEANLKADGMSKSEYGVADIPVLDGSKTPIMTHVAGINVSIFQNSKHKAAALAFVKFLTSQPQQVTLNQDFGSLPVIKTAQADPAFDSKNMKTFNKILANNAAPMPEIPQEGQMEQFMGSAIKGLIATAASKGSVTDAQVKAALDDANQKMAAAG